MKRCILILMAIFICTSMILLIQKPAIEPDTQNTAPGIVTDRAMAANTPYISIQFANGTALCLWDPSDNKIPNDIHIGDEITVIYGKEVGTDRYLLLEIQ